MCSGVMHVRLIFDVALQYNYVATRRVVMQESMAPFLKPRSLLGDLNCEGREQSHSSLAIDRGSLHINFSIIRHWSVWAIKF